jgi:hypothetical protein
VYCGAHRGTSRLKNMLTRRHFSAAFALRLASLGAVFVAAVAAPLACGGSDSNGAGGAGPDGSVVDGTGAPPGDGGPSPSDDANGSDGSTASDAPFDGANGCPRTPAPADRARRVVISHPFGADAGDKATAFEVLELSQDGTLTRPSPQVTFSMGTALSEPVLFTPDGQIGLVSQDDGSIGVFKLPAAGAPTVVHAAYKGSFYAGGLVLAPDGASVYVMDSNVRANGGGVYQIPIHCDGTLGTATLLIPGSGATEMALLPTDPTKGVLAATAATDSTAGQDVHLVDLAKGTRIASASAFGDGNAIVSAVAVAPDGKFAILADNNTVAGGSRLASVAISPTLAAAGGLLATPFPDGLAISPYGNAGIVLNDDSTDQIHLLSYTPADAGAPFAITGELAYKFGKPQIPTTISMIVQGTLKGTTFVGENIAVRQLTFGSGGVVTDTAKLTIPGAGNDTIVGVVGVQP